MDSETARQPERLALSPTVFHVALVFLMTGLLSGFMQNAYRLWWVDFLIYGLAMAALGLLVLLHGRGRLSSGSALLVAFAVSTVVFVTEDLLSSLFQPLDSFAWMANPQIPLILILFGAVCGLAVDKRAGLWFGGACVLVELWFAFGVRDRAFYLEQLPMNLCVIAGSVVMVWYYRRRLEELVGQLDERLVTVHVLKDRAELLNEQNKPFVVFGRNTAGLIQDFSMEVQLLARDLQELRRAVQPEDRSLLLTRMGSTMDMLAHRIEWVKYVASASPQREEEELDLRTLVDSAIYPFHLLPEYRSSIEFQVDVAQGVVVFGLRRWLLLAIEILVEQGCQDGATRIGLSVRVDEPVLDEGGTVFLAYQDNGSFPHPAGSDTAEVFRLRVEEAVREFSGKVVRHEHPATGTVVVMELGKNLAAALH